MPILIKSAPDSNPAALYALGVFFLTCMSKEYSAGKDDVCFIKGTQKRKIFGDNFELRTLSLFFAGFVKKKIFIGPLLRPIKLFRFRQSGIEFNLV